MASPALFEFSFLKVAFIKLKGLFSKSNLITFSLEQNLLVSFYVIIKSKIIISFTFKMT